MNYSPRGLYIWDAWCMVKDNEAHMYHLQRNRPDADAPPGVEDALGHAVTRDLVNWEEQPPAFGPDENNPDDDRQPWTGCALWHDGTGYLYYTMRGSANDCRLQKIGLATTTDPAVWQRSGKNPVIVPDPKWYATEERPVPGIIDCRDLLIIADPKGKGWLGFYATRVPARELPQTSAIACVRSDDLVRWEHLPPAFVPGNFACIEVPDVFEMDGRWYMTCLTGNFYGNRGYWSDPHLVGGTMFAVADRPEGPYHELEDNVLVGARTTSPISCRSVVFEGKTYVLYTDRERTDYTDCGGMTFGTISTPKELRTSGDRLVAAYSPRIETAVTQELIGLKKSPTEDTSRIWGQIWQMPTARWTRNDAIYGESETGWGVYRFTAKAESFIYEADITLERGAAGLAVRMDTDNSGAIVALEPGDQTVGYYEAPPFDFSERRTCKDLAYGKRIHLRVVNRLEHVEVYVNDVLMLVFSRYRGIGGQVGLFVDRGKASFRNIRLRMLNVRRPQ